MRFIKLCLIGRQRPLQFSEDCGGFDFLGFLDRCGYLSSRWPGGPGPQLRPNSRL